MGARRQRRGGADEDPAFYLPDVIQAVDLWRQAAVHAQELLVEQRGQRQAVKGLHAGVVHPLRVFDFT